MHYARIPRAERRVEKAATVDEVESLAASYAPPIAKAIIEALDKTANEVDLDALAAALAGGDLQKVVSMLHIDVHNVQVPLQDAVWAGGLLAAKSVPLKGLEWHFNRLNPVLVQWLQEYTLGLIRQIDDTTKEAVRQQLLLGMRGGKNPRTQAKDIKAIVGLTDRQAQAVANFRKELETFHQRTSGGGYKLGGKIDRVNGAQVFRQGPGGEPADGMTERRLRDFRYDKQLIRAMEQNKPLTPEQVDKMVDAYARKYRKYRAETIARTESIRALNMGTQEAWRQAVHDGKIVEDLVRRYWKVASDERTCPICNGIADMNEDGVKLGQPFASDNGPIMLPPEHPSCRCHVFIRVLEPQQLKGANQ